ncbi:hypothetical protein Bbelb_227860 [Branchiostoma belcheri]|nr:hypothetical protein Bbelb_227860 [Branchiostoma belcheri]
MAQSQQQTSAKIHNKLCSKYRFYTLRSGAQIVCRLGQGNTEAHVLHVGQYDPDQQQLEVGDLMSSSEPLLKPARPDEDRPTTTSLGTLQAEVGFSVAIPRAPEFKALLQPST